MKALKLSLLLGIFIVCGALSYAPEQSQTLASTTTSSSAKAKKNWVKMEVYDLREYSGGGFLVMLTKKDEENPKWFFPMVIGQCETMGIARAMEDEPFSRPLTYELMGSILKELGGSLQHILITQLDGGTFFAKLYIKQGEEEIQIDSRPSDAINFAMRQEVPIYATKEVIKESKEEFSTSD